MSFNLLDLVLIAIILVAVFFGIVKGFVRDILSLVGIVAAFYFAINYYTLLSGPFLNFIKNPLYAKATAFILILLFVYICFKLIGYTLANLLKSIRLGVVDRFCGAFFGLFKGILVSWLLIFVLSFLSVKSVNESYLVPYLEKAFSIGASFVPSDFKEIIKKRDLKNDRA